MGLRGDPVAAKVAAAALGEVRSHLAAAMARTSGWTLPPVAPVGGLIRPGGPFREAVAQVVEEMGCAVRPREVASERGALLLARSALDCQSHESPQEATSTRTDRPRSRSPGRGA